MKIIYNKWIPFKGFVAINLFGWIFVRSDANVSPHYLEVIVRHERIHSLQMEREGYLKMYAKYLYEYVRNLIKYRNAKMAYKSISYEREAYGEQTRLIRIIKTNKVNRYE